jgi:hypothetical protein
MNTSLSEVYEDCMDTASGPRQDGYEDGTWAAKTEFAAAYDVPMGELEQQIFSKGNNSNGSV